MNNSVLKGLGETKQSGLHTRSGIHSGRSELEQGEESICIGDSLVRCVGAQEGCECIHVRRRDHGMGPWLPTGELAKYRPGELGSSLSVKGVTNTGSRKLEYTLWCRTGPGGVVVNS